MIIADGIHLLDIKLYFQISIICKLLPTVIKNDLVDGEYICNLISAREIYKRP